MIRPRSQHVSLEFAPYYHGVCRYVPPPFCLADRAWRALARPVLAHWHLQGWTHTLENLMEASRPGIEILGSPPQYYIAGAQYVELYLS